MPRRRNEHRPLAVRVAGALGSLLLWSCAKAMRRPVDSFALIAAVLTTLIIIVNAVFLQTGSHPAPFFANPSPPPLSVVAIRQQLVPPVPAPRPADAPRAPQASAVRHVDPIAELIGSSSRIAAVQRVLANYGYGQIKPTGILDEETSAAIERFERERKLPVTGRVSDRLVSELAAMVGHSIQ